MNTEKVQQIINSIIEENHKRIGYKAVRKQYAPAKRQIQTLTELGIIDLMPKGFGHSDASAVIAEAQRGESAVLDANYEGSEIGSSQLYDALHEVVEVVVETKQSTKTFTVADGDEVEVGDATIRFQVEVTYNRTSQEYQVIVSAFLWNNSVDIDDEFGECEVEVENVEVSDEAIAEYLADDSNDAEITISIADAEIAFALALYGDIYLQSE